MSFVNILEKILYENKYIRINPNDMLPLLKDYKPTQDEKDYVQDISYQILPHDSSVEAYKIVPLSIIGPSEKVYDDRVKQLIDNDKELKPIIVQWTPVRKEGEDFKFGIIDGNHRYFAYKEMGFQMVPIAIVTSREDYSFETNDYNILKGKLPY